LRHFLLCLLTGVAAASLCTPANAQSPAEDGPNESAGPAPARSNSYDAAFFAPYAPRTALDIVRRIPGFTLDLGNTDLRGFSGAAGNVVIDGQRPSSKSETLEATLAKIPASRVDRVDVGPGDFYGAQYSGKSQVANLILGRGGAGGLTGNATISANRHWFGNINPNASGSVQWSRGPSTFSLSADTARTDNFEKGYDFLFDGPTGALVERRSKFNRIYDRNPYVSGSWAFEQGENRSIHFNARYQPSRFYLRQVNHVSPVGQPERDDALHQDYDTDIFEIGGDISRPLGGGGLKLVALTNRRKRSTFDDYLVRGEGGAPTFEGFEQLTESRLNESLAKLSWSKPNLAGFNFEIGAEVAYNSLDYSLDLFEFFEDGEQIPIDLPIEDATVRELRGEVYFSAGRALSPTLRVDGGLNFELSRLKVRGDAVADRSLKFLKPSLTLDWQPGNDWHFQLIARRTVAQLDFYDFVSSAELSNDRVNGGNANLVPQRTWEGRFVAEHPLFKNGKVRLEAGTDIVSLLQDRILVFNDKGEAFDAPGNIGTGRRYFADLTVDAPLDHVWKGLRVRGHALLQRTRVKDPVSGTTRNFSDFFPDWTWDVNIRRDAGKWAYGFTLTDRDRFFNFRTDQIDAMPNQRIYGFGFVEYRATPRSSVILDVENFTDSGGYVLRKFFDPDRRNPDPVLEEERFRNGHVRVQLSYKLSFGGGGAASAAQ
jgi:hypothetical protein